MLQKRAPVLTFTVLITVFATGSSETLRQYIFAKIFPFISSKSEGMLRQYRCENIANITGKVLEIGPGTGNNFQCWGNNTGIKKWVGIEPNVFFEDSLNVARSNVNFPTEVIWQSAAIPGLLDDDFDVVIATHVLCSVSDVQSVLQTISSALKPGGTYVFFEHVKAETQDTWNLYLQILFEPVFSLVGNGCQFKNLEAYLKSTPLFTVDTFKSFELPMSIPIMKPHITGALIRK